MTALTPLALPTPDAHVGWIDEYTTEGYALFASPIATAWTPGPSACWTGSSGRSAVPASPPTR